MMIQGRDENGNASMKRRNPKKHKYYKFMMKILLFGKCFKKSKRKILQEFRARGKNRESFEHEIHEKFLLHTNSVVIREKFLNKI